MTENIEKDQEDAFDKIEALVSADKGIVNDAPEEIEIETAAEAAPPAKTETDEVEESIESLRKQLEDAKAARAEAERRIAEADNKARQAEAQSEDSNLKLIDTAIANVKREKEALKLAYREALTVGDYDKATEIQEQMTDNAVNLSRLEQGKQQFINRPKPQPVRSNDPVEAFAAQLPEASASWIRKHPEYVTNAAKQKDMFAAHEAAVGVNRIEPDTPAYFKFVEDWLGIGAEPEKRPESPLSSAAAPKRPVPPAAAPTSRSNAAGVTNPTRITLTAEEREMAELNGMTVQEYAKNKAALLKEGRIGPGRSH